MPKKRLNKTLQTKPSSSAPAALAASTTATSKHGESVATSKPAASSVNELINHLRQTQVSDDPSHRLPQTPRTATVHPSLRSILSVPDTPPPRPRPGSSTTRLSGPTRLRRIAGPPPPASWLAPSAPAHKPSDCDILTNVRAEQSSSLPGGVFPTENSLQHTVFKALATNLHWLEFDSFDLLPTRLKENILSYVAVFQEQPERSGHEGVNPFWLLFPKASADDALDPAFVHDNTGVRRLDLGGAIGRWLSMKEFKELLYAPKFSAVRDVSDVPPDSWDDEDDKVPGLTVGFEAEADATSEAASRDGARLNGGGYDFATGEGHSADTKVDQEARRSTAGERPKPLESMSLRFANLAHLSLALSPTTGIFRKRTAASWSGLLKVAPSLSRLSSLSLAHWPAPTLTPHAASTYTTIKNPVSASLPGISYGGSDMYTSLDGDWTEAANLLKILSRHLYCLQWLDLTGCGDWFSALSAANGAEWTGAWRGMQHVGLCVGWHPEPVWEGNEPWSLSDHIPGTPTSPAADTSRASRFSYIPTSRQMHHLAHDGNEEANIQRRKYYHKKAVEKYMEIQRVSHIVARSINSKRKGLGKWIEFDLSPEMSAMK
jgi:hypothetical protein